MPIQEENVVFVESQVMDDVPEGGGAATGRVIVDGLLNNVFEDVSDLDRAYGRLNLRGLHLAVRSLDTDLYGGAKLAVTGLPSDPALGYALFTIDDPFGTRAEAADRVASYLYKGPMWHGVLYDDHIAGMRAIRIIQRVGTALPPIGKTLCLVQNEGAADEIEQYIRVTALDAVEATVTDASGDFTRLVVTLTLSDALRVDFTGHEPNRRDEYSYTGTARLRDTTVADATSYFSSQPLAEPALIGERQIKAASMFAQLVPSAQVETPLVSQIMAGQVVSTLSAGSRTVEVAQTAHTRALAVTAENRRLNWVETLSPLPAPGTVNIAYMAQGNWYELVDDGAGKIAGSDETFGSGTLVSATASVTLGALPDAGSQIMLTWASPVHYAVRTGTRSIDVRMPLDFGEPIEPGSLTLTLIIGGSPSLATADATGLISGAATGGLTHATGTGWLTLTTLPDPGTTIGVAYNRRTASEQVHTDVPAFGGIVSFSLGEEVLPGSVEIAWSTRYASTTVKSEVIYHYPSGRPRWREFRKNSEEISNILRHATTDDGSGVLGAATDGDPLGTVNYATGELTLQVLPSVNGSTYAYVDGYWTVDTIEEGAQTWERAPITVTYVAQAAIGAAVELEMEQPPLELSVLPDLVYEAVVPGSVAFTLGAYSYADDGGGLLYAGTVPAGTIDYSNGRVELSLASGGTSLNVTACLTRYGLWAGTDACFRAQLAPLKPEALSISVTAADGELLTASADANGDLVADGILGTVNYEFGTAAIAFGAMGDDPDYTGDPPIPQVWIPRKVDPSTLRYNAVAYSYLALDADILGIDPVRLPADGRVPIYRKGDIVLVMNAVTNAGVTPAAGVAFSLGRTRLAWARVTDANGETVSGDLYELDRAAGMMLFPDLAEVATPVSVRHVVGDLRMVTDAQISGWVTVSRELTHDYSAGDSLLASCLLFGDRRARVSASWDQTTWDGVWQDSIRGSAATATLNLIDFPIQVTNEGCDTDRLLFRYLATNTWELISERRGLLWTGTYEPGGADVAPINPRTRTLDPETGLWIGGVPYLVIPGMANGGGWSIGNCVRINLVGAIADFWVARSIQQSDEPLGDGYDSVEIYALGNVDRP